MKIIIGIILFHAAFFSIPVSLGLQYGNLSGRLIAFAQGYGIFVMITGSLCLIMKGINEWIDKNDIL